MKVLKSHSPMVPGTVTMIVTSLSPTQLIFLEIAKIDRRFEGVLEGGGKCIWLKDGRRVEFEAVKHEGFIASVSKTPDPDFPGKE